MTRSDSVMFQVVRLLLTVPLISSYCAHCSSFGQTRATTTRTTASHKSRLLQQQQQESALFRSSYRLDSDLECIVEAVPIVTVKSDVVKEEIGLRMELVYTGGRAWLGLGLSPTGLMTNATAVIGVPNHPTHPVAQYYMSGKVDSAVNRIDDNDQNNSLTTTTTKTTLQDASIVQTSTRTILRYTHPLSPPPTQQRQQQLESMQAGQNTFIYAVGYTNALFYHAKRGTLQINLPEHLFQHQDENDETNINKTETDGVEGDNGLVLVVPEPEPEQRVGYYQKKFALASNLDLHVETNPVQQTITLQLTLAKGSGWLGLGLTNTGLMTNATAVIGLPNHPTHPIGKYYMSGKVDSAVNLIQEENDLHNYLRDGDGANNVAQNRTHTVLRYTRPIQVNDPNDVSFSPARPNVLIYATGYTNSLFYHQTRGTVAIHLPAFTEEDEEEPMVGVPVPEIDEKDESDSDDTLDEDEGQDTSTDHDKGREGNYFTADGSFVGHYVLEWGLLSLRFGTNISQQTMSVELTYDGLAWLAFGRSERGLMVGATAVVGLPSSSTTTTTTTTNRPQKYFMSGKTVGSVERLAENEQDTLTEASIQQNDTHTVLRYTQPLANDAGDSTDIRLDGSNVFIYAIGYNNDWGMHLIRNAFSLELVPCHIHGSTNSVCDGSNKDDEASPPGTIVVIGGRNVDTRSLWEIHGVVMALAWGGMIPLAVASSLLRNLFSSFSTSPGFWFKIHFIAAVSAVLLTLVGFSLAVRAVQDETANGEDANHFSSASLDTPHRTIGFLVVLACIVQIASGLGRPNGPKTTASGTNDNDSENNSQEEQKTTSKKLSDDKTIASNGRTVATAESSVAAKTTMVASTPPVQEKPIEEGGEVDCDDEEVGEGNKDSKEDNVKESKTMVRVLWEYQHRFWGVATLGLSWYTCHSGIQMFEDRYGSSDNGKVFWGLVGLVAGVVAVLFGLQTAKKHGNTTR